MKKNVFRLISTLMTVIMLLQLLPSAIFATDGNTLLREEVIKEPLGDSQTVTQAEDAPPARIVSEDVSKRELNSKQFRMSDGTYTVQIYPQNIHYENDGVLEEIDNTLKMSSKNGKTYYQNTANSMKVKLPTNLSDTDPVEITSDDHTLRWFFLNQESAEATVSQPDTDQKLLATKRQALSQVKNEKEKVKIENSYLTKANLVKSSLSYSVPKENVSLSYDLVGDKMKESIILHKAPTNKNPSFTFKIDVGSTTPELQEDGSVLFRADDDSLVFTMQAPYMWDDNDQYSKDIVVSLENEGDHYLYTITPSADWLFDEARQYPVTIDPTVATQQTARIIKDATGIFTSYNSAIEDALLDDYQVLKVGKISTYPVLACIYVPMPAISDSGRIVKAELNVYFCSGGGVSTSTNPMTVCAYEITEDWGQNTITTNKVLFGDDIPSTDFEPVDYKILNDAASSGSAVATASTFDITRVAQRWATGESVNRGISLEPYDYDLVSNGQYLRFLDSDASGTSGDPFFIYTYRDTKGVEDYWTYTTMAAGRSGTAAVNNFNGNLFVSQNLTGIGGNRLPVTIAAMYDSSSRSQNTYFLGNGWRTNYNMSVHTSTLDSFPYYLEDSDGTQHYFYAEEENSTSWKDEDGLGYTLTRDSSVYTNGYLITDKAKTKSYFRSDGRLGRLQDTFGNHITINYTSANKISSVTDGSGRVYSFAYNSGGNLSSITNPAQKIVSFSYTNGNLTSITYPDAKSVVFSYGDYGLSKITNIDNTYVAFEYTYANSHLYTISMSYFGSNNVSTEDYNLRYQHNRTQITSDTDNTIDAYFQFNSEGKTTSVINNCAGTTEYYKYGATGGTDGTVNKLLSASKTVGYSATGKLAPELIDVSKWISNFFSTAQVSLDEFKGHVSAPSLKVEQTNEEGGPTKVICDAGIVKAGKSINMSAYINADGLSSSDHSGIYISAFYMGSQGITRSGKNSGYVVETMGDAWISLDASITVPEETQVFFEIGGEFYTDGAFWIDDVAFDTTGGHLNYVENSNFNNAADGWDYLVNGVSAEKISDRIHEGSSYSVVGDPSKKIGLKRTLQLSGKAGDVLCFGACSNAFSVPNGMVKTGSAGETTWRVRLELLDENGPISFLNNENILSFDYGLGYNDDDALGDLQTLQANLIAPSDFTSVVFYFDFDYNIGGTFLHKPFVYLENTAESYAYDANGNVVSTVDLASTEATFAYQDNNLSQMINPTGSRYSYTYNEETNALEYAASSDGQLYAFVYDEYGNVVSSTQRAFQNAGTISDGAIYYIRNAATGNLLRASGTDANSLVQNGSLANQDDSIRWKVEYAGESDTFYLSPLSASEFQLESNEASLVIDTAATSANQKFKILSNDDGTFRILLSSDDQKALDGRDTANDNDTTLGSPITLSTYSSTHAHQKWYFTPCVENAEEKIISASSAYTNNGTYVSSVTDTLGNTASYTYNSDGTVSTVTDSKGNQTQYTYDHNNGQVLAVVADNSNVQYTYENARLKSIETPNDTIYTFQYDEHGRTTSILVNRKDSTSEPRTLVSYLYSSDVYYSDVYNSDSDQEELPLVCGSLNNVARVIYGNGYEIYKDYDSKLGLIAVDGDNRYTYLEGKIFTKESFRDINTETFYYYDLAGRPTSQVMLNSFEDSYSPRFSIAFKYQDHTNLLDSYSTSNSEFRLKTSFVYGDPEKGEIPEAVYGIKTNDELALAYSYDSFARRSSRTLHAGDGITTTYTYKSSDNLNHFGVIPEGASYTPNGGSQMSAGAAFPVAVTNGDVYCFGDYRYTYSSSDGGWAVSLNYFVTDSDQTSYGRILESINCRAVKSLADTFHECVNLTAAPKIPEGVTCLDYAFMNCAALTKAPAIPSNVVSMIATFGNCTSLASPPNMENAVSVTDLSSTFYGCTALETAPPIPEGVTTMYATFLSCSSLVIAPAIPDSVTNMYGTFYGCSSLTSAPAIPENVTTMFSTFLGCSSLVTPPDLSQANSVTDFSYAFFQCTSLASAPVVPGSVTNMYASFYTCISLTTAPIIPQNVTNMYGTFSYCSELTGNITVNANPTTYTDCFDDTEKPIHIIGSCSDATKIALAGTSPLGNVTYSLSASENTRAASESNVLTESQKKSEQSDFVITPPIIQLSSSKLRQEIKESETIRSSAATASRNNAASSGNSGSDTSSTVTTGTLVESISEEGFTSRYTYDANGNITGFIRTNDATGEKVETWIYEYDAKNQLTFAGTDASHGTRYTYDSNGNLLTKTDVATGAVKSYAYTDPTWADLLTAYDGSSITYDAIGNPLTYRDGMSFAWSYGRSLASATVGDETYHFGYDADGIRVEKRTEDLSKIVQYMVMDGALYGEQHVTQNDSESNTITINYLLDENSTKYGFILNGNETYYYRFNLQGDVTGIYDSTGALIVEYSYDAWGKLLSVSGNADLGNLNPIRYRGYYYDVETGLYYVSSRYYDPEIGRWISPEPNVFAGAFDLSSRLNGYNVYIYCANNPICFFDSTGEWTCSIGWSFSAYLLGGCTYSVSLAFDPSGNIALQTTKADVFKKNSGGTFGFAAIGVSKSYTITKLETVFDLEGPAINTGKSVLSSGILSADYEKISTVKDKSEFVGLSVSGSLGASVAAGAHKTVSITKTVAKINVVDVVKNVWSTIVSWFGRRK